MRPVKPKLSHVRGSVSSQTGEAHRLLLDLARRRAAAKGGRGWREHSGLNATSRTEARLARVFARAPGYNGRAESRRQGELHPSARQTAPPRWVPLPAPGW